MTTTSSLANTTAEPSRQVRRARARQAARAAAGSTPEAESRRLTPDILDAASAKAAAAAQAAALAKAQLAETEVQAWLKDMNARLDVIFAHPEQNLGEVEEPLARSVKEPLRLLAQRAAQVKANAVACQCPDCHGELTQQPDEAASRELGCYASSLVLDQYDDSAVLAAIRGHWSAIENGTHYRRDVSLGEDANRTAGRKGAAALASLRNLANGIYELEREAKRTGVDTLRSWCQQQTFSTVWPILQR